MKWFACLIVGALALSLVAGCTQTTQVITLNPDGSGKAVFKCATPPRNLIGAMMDAGDVPPDPDPAKTARDALRDIIGTFNGVDAWADLTCKSMVDGRVEMTGVAYFADFNKLAPFYSDMGGHAKWTAVGKSGTLEIKPSEPTSKPEPKAMTDQQVAAAVEEAKAKFQKERQSMAPFVRSFKYDITFLLPGAPENVEGLTKTDTGGVRLLVEGQRMLEVMDRVMGNDKLLAAAIRDGWDFRKEGPKKVLNDAMMEGLFGKKLGALTATCSDMKPQFDYQAEMTKAKAGQADLLKKLGIDGPGK